MKIRKLINKLKKSEELVEVREGRLHEHLYPLMDALTGEQMHYSIERIRTYNEYLAIVYGGYCKGCAWQEEVQIPWTVIDSDNPVEAAKVHKEHLLQEKKKREIEQKKQQIRELQKELKKEN